MWTRGKTIKGNRTMRKRLIEWLIKKFLPDYHLKKRPAVTERKRRKNIKVC